MRRAARRTDRRTKVSTISDADSAGSFILPECATPITISRRGTIGRPPSRRARWPSPRGSSRTRRAPCRRSARGRLRLGGRSGAQPPAWGWLLCCCPPLLVWLCVAANRHGRRRNGRRDCGATHPLGQLERRSGGAGNHVRTSRPGRRWLARRVACDRSGECGPEHVKALRTASARRVTVSGLGDASSSQPSLSRCCRCWGGAGRKGRRWWRH